MSRPAPRFPTTVLRLGLLSLPLLLAACGGTSNPQTQTSALSQTPTGPQTSAQSPLLTTLKPSAVSGGVTISDRAASNGQAARLLSGGSSARFQVPQTLAGGAYEVRVRARGEAYQGWPVVALRQNGRQLATNTLESAAYAAHTFGTFALQPGDSLEVVFTNDAYGGSRDKDRNAVLDTLMLRAVERTNPPAPAPAPAPVPADALDVKAFGAKGDGVTDDTAALNALARRTNGKDVFFSPGTYLISGPVVFGGLSSQRVLGQNATLKASPRYQRGSVAAYLTFNNSQNLTVSGLSIVGHRTNTMLPSTDIEGVQVVGGHDVTLSGLKVRLVPSNGIRMQEVDGFTLSDNVVSEMGRHGIWTSKSTRQTLLHNTVTGGGAPTPYQDGLGILATIGDGFLAEGNTITQISDTATKTEGVSNVTYRGNTVDTYGKDGIKIMPYPPAGITQVTNGVIEDNTISNFKRWKSDGSGGVLLQSVIGGHASGNKISGTPTLDYEDGIRVNAYGSGPQSKNIVVEDNDITNVRSYGILLHSPGTIIRNNVIRSSAAERGLYLGPAASNVQILGNTFDGEDMGILFNSGVGGVTVSKNKFANSPTGIYAASAGNDNNTFTYNEFAASTNRTIVESGRNNACYGNTGNVPADCR